MKKVTNLRICLAILIVFMVIAPAISVGDVIVSFPLDADPGWAMEGEWEFGNPLGAGSSCGDPTSGHTGTKVYGYNLSGDYSNDMPEYSLTTTALDCSGYENVTLIFWRWLGVESSLYDNATIEVSNGFGTVIWEHKGGDICDSGWVECVYDISDVADGQSTVYIRWTMGATDSSITYPGWNIDDVSLVGEIQDDLEITPLGAYVCSGNEGGPFSPANQLYTLTNVGTSTLNWTASKTQPWLDIDLSGDTLDPGDSTDVTVLLNGAADSLPAGNYSDTVTFTNTTSGNVETREVTLEVLPAGAFLYFPLDTDPGWSMEGNWEFGVPLGGGVYCSDPTSGHTGTNVYGYNLSGDYADNMPEYYLTTMAMDCSGYENVTLNFWRWLGVESVWFDHAKVEVSNDGSNWTVVWEHNDNTVCDSAWVECIYDISDVADVQSTVYIRWTMGPTDGSVTYPGWNIDDVCLIGDLMDDLDVTPSEGFYPSGYEGGPFDPLSKNYTLTNTGSTPLNWTASKTQPWLDVAPNSGTLDPGSPEVVAVSLNPIADTLSINTYSDDVIFTNTTSDAVQIRGVTLDVMPIPGEIEVTDSIPVPSDLNMPFGEVIIGLSRTEQITIYNADPIYDLIISDILLNNRSIVPGESSELTITLPGVKGGSKDTTGMYLPPEWIVPDRASTTLVVNSGYRTLSGNMNILLLASGGDPTVLRTALTAFPDIETVEYFDCSSFVPAEVDLTPYDIVVVMSNYSFADATQTGNVLADYVDNGGKVIQAVASFASGGGWELAGRFVTGGYEPFTHGNPAFFPHSLGSFDSDHPIMDGVTSLTDSLTVDMDLQAGAEWVADWDNGTPLVATQGQDVAGINIFAFDSGDFTGDVPLLFHNAIVWLAGQTAFELELPAGTLPITIPPSEIAVIDASFVPTDAEEYESNLVIVSNDEDESEVEILLSGTGVIDYLEIFPEEAIEFCGHPGGPFVPCSQEYQYNLTNNHTTENIGWSATLTVPWLDIWPGSGELQPGESINVWVSINAAGEGLAEGQYPGPSAIVFTDIFTTLEQPRDVNLEVFTSPKVWVAPDSFDVTLKEGGTLTETLTIGNTGDAILNFNITSHEIHEIPAETTTCAPVTSNETRLPEYNSDKFVSSNNTTESPDYTAIADVPYKEGELIIRFERRSDGKLASLADKQQILSSLDGGTIKREFSIVPGLNVIKLPAGMSIEDALQTFNATDGILYAQPNYQVHAISTFPNDTRFGELWGMHNTGQTGGTVDADIDAPEAWDIATGSSEVIVAVIDSGVDYDHVDLAANMWVNAGEIPDNGLDDDGNGYVDDVHGYDFYNNDGDPYDDFFHGTHCAGTIGATGNNSDGVTGVCWNVKIMALKFLDSYGYGWSDDAIGCIEYSVLMGANLSSNSWGGGGYSQGLKDAIDDAGDAGLLFVAAAGNDYGNNNDTYAHYPSSYDCESIIAVMSTDDYDNMSFFSNYGPTSVDLGAPGSFILSCFPGDQYQYLDGTSMATPHVAGACALLWSMNPLISSADLKNILIDTVDPTLADLCVSGGRLNLFNSVKEMKTPWIEIEPENGGTAPGDSNDVSVIFDAMALEPGVYKAEIVVASNDPLTPTVLTPVMMTVTLNPLETTPENGFEFNGFEGGPFAPEHQSFTVTNNGSVPLDWTAEVDVDWLSMTPQSGTLDPNAFVIVDVRINENANTLARNEEGYTAFVTFSNTANGASMHPVTLWVTGIDYFTELFDSEDNDLDYQILTFSPDGSMGFYNACREVAAEFPVDPNGGNVLSLGDDDYEQVTLSAGVVSLYGESFNSLFVGSNGYITFGIGDTQYIESPDNHFMFKRISGLFDDLSPDLGGQVSWKELADRAVVTFENVPAFQEAGSNNFQIEMFFGGTIRITYLDISADSGLAGLSKGENTPIYFEESDLSNYYLCCDFQHDNNVNMKDFALFAKHWQETDCGFCGGADLTVDGNVLPDDLVAFAQDWLENTVP